MTWVLVLRIRGGHRYFREEGTGRIAVADDSGATPDRTEDGILYLDTGRPIRLGEQADIRLLSPDGRRYSTVESAAHGVLVAAHLGLEIEVDGEEGRRHRFGLHLITPPQEEI